MQTHPPLAYAELHCLSSFSFQRGASQPEELVQRAAALGYSALAITDECSVAGVVRAHAEVRKEQLTLKLLLGAEFSVPLDSGHRFTAVVLAHNLQGWGNLCQFITVARRAAPKGQYQVGWQGAANQALWAQLSHCEVLLLFPDAMNIEAVCSVSAGARGLFGLNLWLAAAFHLGPGDALRRVRLQQLSALSGVPIVATGGVRMHVRSRKPLHDVMTAVRLGQPVAQCGFALQANAERHLRSLARLAALYPAAWLANTQRIADRCTFDLQEIAYQYPMETLLPGSTPAQTLRYHCDAGARDRYPHSVPDKVNALLERELSLIADLKYEMYFLTVHDIVRYARSVGILCQGRGSAANSAVCYCLGVTEVDPARTNLLFERFISKERDEPPDIDVDFEHQRREEVIQYIYGKYGRHRAALTAVVISYRPRSAVRDVGRALGIDLQRIDAVAKGQQWFDGRSISAERLRENGFDPESPVVRQWVELTHQLIGFPRHLSQHPGGFVIARDQIEQLVPVENAAMKDRSVVQWDKDDLDVLGLIKVDILALGMLSALRRSFELIGRKLGESFDTQQVPRDDRPTYDMICAADTVGVFQIESRAQMSMLPRLQPRCYYDLVVEVAIVRPGPIQGGMVHPYLKNRLLDDDQIDYPMALRPALQRTKGVPIFQEQVMQIAIIAADFTPGEADALRRAMAAWKRKGGLGPFHERLVGRMVEKGYERDYAERIFKQIEGFGEYGFPESHAAGFALLVYVSCWVKRHHPDAFLCALLNSQPLGFYAPAQLVRDAREHGVQVRAVDVAVSELNSVLEGLDAPVGEALLPVRLGLDRVGGLSIDAAQRIVDARAAGPFSSVEDLARRAALDAQALQSLAQADALRGLAGHRHQAAWAVAGVDTRATPMLRDTRVHEVAAALEAPSEVEDTLADYRSLGLTLQRHPIALLREELSRFKVQTAAVLKTYPHGRLARASGLVTHRQRPETAKGTTFVTLEDETGAVNVIVWPRVFEAHRRELLGTRLLTVYGQWQREGEVMHLVAMKLIDHSPLFEGLVARSRDFR